MTLAVVNLADPAADPQLVRGFAGAAHRILVDLVGGGAALGWVDPPDEREVVELFDAVLAAGPVGNSALRAAYRDGRLVGFGYWTRYARPTHSHNADVQKIAVAASAQGQGIGRLITTALIDDARRAGVEILTLDVRADNTGAQHLYETLGFREYGRIPNFVGVHENRYDKVCYHLPLPLSGRS